MFYDVRFWFMGLMCLLLVIVLIVDSNSRWERRLSDIEKDYDERPRGREK